MKMDLDPEIEEGNRQNESKSADLLDEKGKLRAGVALDKDGPWLSLLDENGKRRAGLAVLKDGAGLVLYDENGKAIWSAPR